MPEASATAHDLGMVLQHATSQTEHVATRDLQMARAHFDQAVQWRQRELEGAASQQAAAASLLMRGQMDALLGNWQAAYDDCNAALASLREAHGSAYDSHAHTATARAIFANVRTALETARQAMGLPTLHNAGGADVDGLQQPTGTEVDTRRFAVVPVRQFSSIQHTAKAL